MDNVMFKISKQNLKQNSVVLLACVVALVVVEMTFNLVTKGKLLNVHIVTSPHTFIMLVAMETFLLALQDHFVCIALPKEITWQRSEIEVARSPAEHRGVEGENDRRAPAGLA